MAETSNLVAALPDDAAEAKIRAALAAYNQSISRIKLQTWIRLLFALSACASVFGYVLIQALALENDKLRYVASIWTVIPGLIAAAFLRNKIWRYRSAFQQTFRDETMPLIFGFVQNFRRDNGNTPDCIRILPGNDLVRRSGTSDTDVISGHWSGISFQLRHTVFYWGGPKARKITYRGIILHARRDTAFPGELLATVQDQGFSGFVREKIGKQRLKSVSCGLDHVDANYRFLTNKPSVAEPWVQGDLVEFLEAYNGKWPDGWLRLAFKGPDCFLLVPMTKNILDLTSITEPLDYQQHVVPMIEKVLHLLQAMQKVAAIGAPKIEAVS